jgi:hypothetical protein
MNTSVWPGSRVAAADHVPSARPYTKFAISLESCPSRRRVIVTDRATGTEIYYSHNSAEELLNEIARALGKSVETAGDFMDRGSWRKEVTREERQMEHRASEQRSGFATTEQLETWGFNSEAIAECLSLQPKRM